MSDTRPRILFAGSPEFAVPCLAALVDSPGDVVAVLTQPDRPSGRGRKLRAGPVKQFALANGIEVLQPESLAGQDIRQQLASLRPDIAVIVAYGLLLPPAVLDIPRAGCVNVHASLLPRWRGASPIQAAILAGDRESGISIMQMEAGLDTGPVFAMRAVDIAVTETADSLHDRLAVLGAQLLSEVIGDILDGTATAVAQDDAGASYAGRISKADAVIDWCEAAELIDRRIRAYCSWPVAETLLDGQRMRCWSAVPAPELAAEPETPPGRVVGTGAAGADVQTGSGILRLTEIQLPGRQRMAAGQFANGYPLIGKTLGE